MGAAHALQTIFAPLARHLLLKHAIDCANVEVHMLIKAGAKPVDEGHCDYVQVCLVRRVRARAMDLQSLLNHPQKNAQHHAQHRAITLHAVPQPLDHRTLACFSVRKLRK